MGKRKKFTNLNAKERVENILKTLKIKDLKQAAIVRRLSFRQVTEFSVTELQSWLLKNWDSPVDRTLLNDYDLWMEKELKEEGLEDLIHPLLRFGYLGEDSEGNEIRRQIKNVAIPNVKSKKELALYKPRKGSKKSYVFEIIRGEPNITTIDLIEKVRGVFPDVSEGSVKSWASRARKSLKYEKEIKFEG